jgi:hypothetical protein
MWSTMHPMVVMCESSAESRELPSESSLGFHCFGVHKCDPSTTECLARRGGSQLPCLFPSGLSLLQFLDIPSELAESDPLGCTSLSIHSATPSRLSPVSASPFPHTMLVVPSGPSNCCSSSCDSGHRLRHSHRMVVDV